MRAKPFQPVEIVNALEELRCGTAATSMCTRLGITPRRLRAWKLRWLAVRPEDLAEELASRRRLQRYRAQRRRLDALACSDQERLVADLALVRRLDLFVTPPGVRRRMGLQLDALGLASGSRLLVLDCGMGHSALEAARRGHQVLALDGSLRAIRWVESEAARLGLTSLDPRRWRPGDVLPPGPFDALLLFMNFDGPRLLDRLARRLVPNGRLLVIDPSSVGWRDEHLATRGYEKIAEVPYDAWVPVLPGMTASVYRHRIT